MGRTIIFYSQIKQTWTKWWGTKSLICQEWYNLLKNNPMLVTKYFHYKI